MTEQKVLVFGAFDPLHPGHHYFLQQARQLGTWLLVVVTRDAAMAALKSRSPYQAEGERAQAIAQLPYVDQVILGDSHPQNYELLKQLQYDILALGYDQVPSDKATRQLLDQMGKLDVKLVRLPAFKPGLYKSTYFRN